jgi:hypothetical protein
MAIITTGTNFNPTQTVTSTELNNIANAATFDDPVDDSTLELHIDGKLRIKDAGITPALIAGDAVTTPAILDANVTFAKLTDVIDDDTMATATDTTLATSESIKAYIDKLKPNIVQAVKTDIFSILTPNMVFADIPDLEVTITPKFSNSKILISSTINASSNSNAHGNIFRYVRDGSAIALGDTRGSRTPCTFGSGYGGQYTSNVAGMDYLDSSSITAGTPITYKIQVTAHSTIDVLINEVQTDNDANYITCPISTLTVTEIYQ